MMIKRVSLKYAKLILLLVIILMVTVKVCYTNRTDFDIDLLDKQLTLFKKYINPDVVIGFYNNSNDSGVYIESEFIMAPLVIVNSTSADTLILVQYKSKKLKNFEHYRVIAQNDNGDRIVSLITKSR